MQVPKNGFERQKTLQKQSILWIKVYKNKK